MNQTDTITIYTDGACSGNPGPGGWGAYILEGNNTKELYGSSKNTTNNRMEISAAIEALKSIKSSSKIILNTDSVYLKNGITEWIHNWIKRGWRSSSNGLVKNVDLWKELHELTKFHNISWHWVKGHNSNAGNEKADYLANIGKKQAMR